jgi:hypothetical protein
VTYDRSVIFSGYSGFLTAGSDVVKSRRQAIFAGYCPFLAGYFSMSKKIM